MSYFIDDEWSAHGNTRTVLELPQKNRIMWMKTNWFVYRVCVMKNVPFIFHQLRHNLICLSRKRVKIHVKNYNKQKKNIRKVALCNKWHGINTNKTFASHFFSQWHHRCSNLFSYLIRFPFWFNPVKSFCWMANIKRGFGNKMTWCINKLKLSKEKIIYLIFKCSASEYGQIDCKITVCGPVTIIDCSEIH